MKTYSRSVQASPKPILWRILVPLTVAIALVIVGFTIQISIQHNNQLKKSIQWILKDTTDELSRALAEQSGALAAVEAVLIQETGLQGLLKSQDRQRLLDAYAPVFTKLKKDYSITHFYFMDTHRICLLRVHKPEKFGDRFDRYTALEAERTGKIASGIEIGPLGTLTLRVVQPVFDGEILIGYLELGKEIEDILAGINQHKGIEMAVVLKKRNLNRESWEAGMEMLDREADWEEFPEHALIYSTLFSFPKEVGAFIDVQKHQHGETSPEIRFNDATWRFIAGPLQDAFGIEIGDLIVMRDVSALKAANQKSMILSTGIAIGLFSILLTFSFILLRRTDAGILAQQSELSLRENEKIFRTVADNFPKGILVIYDKDFHHTLVAGEGLREAKLSADMLLGKKPRDLFPSEFCNKLEKYLNLALNGEQETFEIPLNNFVFLQTVCPLYKDGQVNSILGVMINITERKQAEEALRKSEKEYKSTLNNLFIGVVVHADDTSIIFCNPEAENILGLTYDQMSGKKTIDPAWNFVHEDLSIMKVEDYPVGRVFSTKKMLTNYTIGIIRSDRDYVTWVIVNAIPVFSTNKELEKVIVNFVDITERKQAEEEKKSLQKKLMNAHKLESIGTLAGGIAHDFNNLLYVVMGNISLAQDGLNLELETSESLKEAEQACIKAKELTARLITFSKGGDPVKKMTPINDLLKDMVISALSKSNITPKISIADDIRHVSIDEGQIKQVVRNIVVNAIEAIGDNGQLTVSCENVDIAEKGYLTLNQGEYIKISFKDQGCGISKENLEKIFNPYFSTKDMGVDKGQGLGLTVSYSIIQKHRGLIAVESETGTGSTFSVYLPTFLVKEPDLQKSEEKPKAQESIKKPATSTGKILLMDDERAIRKFLGRVINKLGYDVETCIEGKEVVEIYTKAMESKQPFDVVILDLTNKIGMGGQATMKKLLEINPDAKGIVITGYSDDPVVANFRAYGFSGFITKPATMEELNKVIKEILS
jgi:two-component system cell cycle sensor histidine kinase/response regulator CckA